MAQVNNSISEFFYNTDFNVIDIKATSNTNEFSVSDYILTLLLHNSFKTFDSGETFAGSVMDLLSNNQSIQFKGNLKYVLTNASISESHKERIVDEIRSCLSVGIDNGIYTLSSQNDITISDRNNTCYITINIVFNKRLKPLVFYYNKTIGQVVLDKIK